MPASRAVRVKRRPIPPHPPATATRVPGGGIKANPDIYPPTIVIEETLPSSREVSSVYRRKMIASTTFPGNNHRSEERRVGKEDDSTGRYRWSSDHSKNNKIRTD